MYILRAIISWGWAPILITTLAVLGFLYEWEVWAIAPIMITILIIGLVIATVGAKEKALELSSQRLRQLSVYFQRRFTGNSSISIFAVIDSLINIENPEVWVWARACDLAQRVFTTWCNSFIARVESDIRTRRFDVYLHTYLNELWLLNSHYYDIIEEFCEVAHKIEIPRDTMEQYNRFVMEYNAFVQNFRDNISELKKAAWTEIEPPSIKYAKELAKEL